MSQAVYASFANGYYDLSKAYGKLRPNTVLVQVDARGNLTGSVQSGNGLRDGYGLTSEDRLRLVEESLRWGQPAVTISPNEHYVWAVPFTVNNRLIGGAIGVFDNADCPIQDELPAEVHGAAYDLFQLSMEMNLTNGALLRENRRAADYEASRATAIHGLKDKMYTSVRQMYLKEEDQLKAAIGSRDRRAAREVLNRILVGVYSVGSQDLDLLKSVVLEFVAVIYRAAVDAGGDPLEMLGLNYRSYLTLFELHDEVQLAHWLVDHLEQLMDCLKLVPDRPPEARVQDVLRYMREHFEEDISRESVAEALHVNPSHLSHLIKEKLDTTFSGLLTDMRISKAKELLVRTEKGLSQIAQESGFTDQSYFTKVFHKKLSMTPKDYRSASRNSEVKR